MFMLIPIEYPAGKGKGKEFYTLRLSGKGTKQIYWYANRRVNALPLPYPAHCHPWLRGKRKGKKWMGVGPNKKDGPSGYTYAGRVDVGVKRISFLTKTAPNCDFYSRFTFFVITEPDGWVRREG
jgi:hypothetical protein